MDFAYAESSWLVGIYHFSISDARPAARPLWTGKYVLTLTALAVLFLTWGTGYAEATGLVVPNANFDVDAESHNKYPLLVNGGMRYQQVHDAEAFSTFNGATSSL